MKDKELRRIIGERAKSRRTELNLTQPYVADKMGVTASTIQRYEAGTIDNTKKMVLEGLSEALLIRDAMTGIIENLPTNLDNADGDFAKNLLLAILNEYKLFADSFTNACNNFKGNTEYADVAAKMGFESNQEYNEIMFLREITHSVNAFNDIADIIRTYSKNPDVAAQRLSNLLEDTSDSV